MTWFLELVVHYKSKLQGKCLTSKLVQMKNLAFFMTWKAWAWCLMPKTHECNSRHIYYTHNTWRTRASGRWCCGTSASCENRTSNKDAQELFECQGNVPFIKLFYWLLCLAFIFRTSSVHFPFKFKVTQGYDLCFNMCFAIPEFVCCL